MKKVKIMLTTMVVLGTVGGVLASKAKRMDKFCTTATVNGVCPSNARCPHGTLRKIDPTGVARCYVVTANTANCAKDQPVCSQTARFTAN